jgi:hypothetical protein
VNFLFTNQGPLASSITDVYFDDGTLLGIAGVTNFSGVDFSQAIRTSTGPAVPEPNVALLAIVAFACGGGALRVHSED